MIYCCVSLDTPEGSRTPAACLEGKHDNRFTTGVLYEMCIVRVYMCVRFAESFCFCVIGQLVLHFICHCLSIASLSPS